MMESRLDDRHCALAAQACNELGVDEQSGAMGMKMYLYSRYQSMHEVIDCDDPRCPAL